MAKKKPAKKPAKKATPPKAGTNGHATPQIHGVPPDHVLAVVNTRIALKTSVSHTQREDIIMGPPGVPAEYLEELLTRSAASPTRRSVVVYVREAAWVPKDQIQVPADPIPGNYEFGTEH